MRTRVKDVLWFCVICKQAIDGKANDVGRVCSGTEEEPHVPIEMKPT